MAHWIRSAVRIGLAAALATAAPLAAPLAAQPLPSTLALSLRAPRGAALEVSVDRPSHLTIFAVARSSFGHPIQLLAVEQPLAGQDAPRWQRVRANPLSGGLDRFELASEVVVLAFASASPPRLDQFLSDGRWATDRVLSDSALADGNRLITSLAEAIYAKGQRYVARLLPVELESLVPPEFGSVARVFAVFPGPLTEQMVLEFARIEAPGLTHALVYRSIMALVDQGEVVAIDNRAGEQTYIRRQR